VFIEQGEAMKYEKFVLKIWEHRGEIREEPYKREIVPLFGPELRDVPEMNVNVTYINPFSGTNYHNHVIGELIFILSGRGEVLLENERYPLEPDVVFFIPAGVFHHVKNTGPETLKLFNVFAPGIERERQKSQIVIAEPPDESEIISA
jgi:mannose-6-phosphate isomerase-like protein (cupin superfamily)